jgi:hypothetical protein
MTIRTPLLALVAASAVALASAPALAGPIGYALGNGGTTLHSFDVDSPGMASAVTISGAVSNLDDIDFRPLTGQLYGYSDLADRYVVVDMMTGVTTLASTPPFVTTNTNRLGLDFNPVIDRARIVTELDQNVVFNPNNGATTQFTDLFYAAGDPNAGANPQVVANGYTNSMLGGLAGSTVQYVLDSNLDILATLANNTGVLTTVGSLGLDITEDAGLDIFYDPILGTNSAYALLNVGGSSGLYTIDLSSGAAAFIGSMPTGVGTVTGLAIAPAIAPVPEPSSLAMIGLGGLGVATATALRRRRRS